MSRAISRAESWERTYEAFQNINFAAFDYNTIKQSIVEYLQLYFPEDFNDYIESSEFIALIETFAYVGELLAYRLDLNAHENFISNAQRKESILRLAKFISYKPTRNVAARGLVKITSISTTELIFDSVGRNLQNKEIRWNDSTNSNWKEQFILIMNRVLDQRFGSVAPNERKQIQDVLYEVYRWKNNNINNGIFSYTTAVSNRAVQLELVPVELEEFGPVERRPEYNVPFSILYGSDSLGDSSDFTGFFVYTKQGTLNKASNTFDGVTPNQTMRLSTNNINDTDVWVNKVDPVTHAIYTDPDDSDFRSGEWVEVDLAHAQNIIFNTNSRRQKYEIETLDNDQIQLIFGDGEFAEIPNGNFEIWYRTSDPDPLPINRNAVVNKQASFTYQDKDNHTQTFNFKFSLIQSLQNASPAEDIEHIRNVAPSVYYTQDRMVNARDYNVFMLQDPSIYKLRSVNRTFAGDSKYIGWHDPKEYYENVRMMGDDLAVYYYNTEITQPTISYTLTSNEVVTLYIEPLLASTDMFNIMTSPPINLHPSVLRHSFRITPLSFAGTLSFDSDLSERQMILDKLENDPKESFDIYYSALFDEWTVGEHPNDGNSISLLSINSLYNGSDFTGWDLSFVSRRLIVHSDMIRFWHHNDGKSVITYDTLNVNRDTVVVLKANENADRTGLLSKNQTLDVLSSVPYEEGLPDAGLANIHELNVLPADDNKDGIPDNLELDELIHTKIVIPYDDSDYVPALIELPKSVFIDQIEKGISVTLIKQQGRIPLYMDTNWVPVRSEAEPDFTNILSLVSAYPEEPEAGDIIEVVLFDYVYFTRDSVYEPWRPIPDTEANRRSWRLEVNENVRDRRYKREIGRYPLNFAWLHNTRRYSLVDPSTTNIIDSFIITRGYYQNMYDWLTGISSVEPSAPTPHDLRSSYSGLIGNKMISDTLILHPGIIKVLFGSKASPELQASFKIIRSPNGVLSDNQVRVKVVDLVRAFFHIDNFEFGETFYFTELSTAIHNSLPSEIDSVVLVPRQQSNYFGDLFQVYARENEILQPHVTVDDIEIVSFFTADNLKQNCKSTQ